MRVKRKKKFEQTEQFNAHKNILNNLIPGENILYQLKSYKKDYESQFYITNKRICIVHNLNRSGEIRFYISLDDLQGISLKKKKYADDFGEIEFISEKLKNHIGEFSNEKRHSKFFYVGNSLKNIIKIIESIICYYTNFNDRLDRLKNEENVQIPNEFSDFFYNNKIIVLRGGFFKPVEFNQNLYLTYSTTYVGSHKSLGEIIFKPSYDSRIKIECKYYNDSLKVLELIYFLSLFWKFKNNTLISKEDLLDLQKKLKLKEENSNNKEIIKEQLIIKTCFKCGARLRSPYESCSICGVKQRIFLEKEKKIIDLRKELLKSEKKRYFDCALKDSDRYEFSEKLYNQYESYLNKDEKILLYYKEKVFNNFSLAIIFMAFIDIISFFLMIYFFF